MASYRIRVPQVVHETVDGEVVAIDFTTGTYYSLRGPAEAVWAALTADGAVDQAEVIRAVAERYAAEDLSERVMSFLDDLSAEGLLVRDDAGTANGTSAPGNGGQPLGDLAFEKFTDMEEIILLDPVHDVSEAGWPHAPA